METSACLDEDTMHMRVKQSNTLQTPQPNLGLDRNSLVCLHQAASQGVNYGMANVLPIVVTIMHRSAAFSDLS